MKKDMRKRRYEEKSEYMETSMADTKKNSDGLTGAGDYCPPRVTTPRNSR